MPSVEIAALCDVDDSVMAMGCKMVEDAGHKRPVAYADVRKFEDKSIDAISIATPAPKKILLASRNAGVIQKALPKGLISLVPGVGLEPTLPLPEKGF